MERTGALSIPVRLGEPVSHAGVAVLPMFANGEPGLEFVSLDEALVDGLSVEEVDEAGRFEPGLEDAIGKPRMSWPGGPWRPARFRPLSG